MWLDRDGASGQRAQPGHGAQRPADPQDVVLVGPVGDPESLERSGHRIARVEDALDVGVRSQIHAAEYTTVLIDA